MSADDTVHMYGLTFHTDSNATIKIDQMSIASEIWGPQKRVFTKNSASAHAAGNCWFFDSLTSIYTTITDWNLGSQFRRIRKYEVCTLNDTFADGISLLWIIFTRSNVDFRRFRTFLHLCTYITLTDVSCQLQCQKSVLDLAEIWWSQKMLTLGVFDRNRWLWTQ